VYTEEGVNTFDKDNNDTQTNLDTEVKEDEEDEEKEGIKEGIGLGGLADMVLYVTISVVVGITGYIGWKIFKAKRG